MCLLEKASALGPDWADRHKTTPSRRNGGRTDRPLVVAQVELPVLAPTGQEIDRHKPVTQE